MLAVCLHCFATGQTAAGASSELSAPLLSVQVYTIYTVGQLASGERFTIGLRNDRPWNDRAALASDDVMPNEITRCLKN